MGQGQAPRADTITMEKKVLLEEKAIPVEFLSISDG